MNTCIANQYYKHKLLFTHVRSLSESIMFFNWMQALYALAIFDPVESTQVSKPQEQ